MTANSDNRINPLTYTIRTLPDALIPRLRKAYPTNPIFIVLDNVYDTFNIGSFFRLADAIGAKELILCGITETPPNKKISRSSIGLDRLVKWRYFDTTSKALTYLKTEQNAFITVVEQAPNAVMYTQMTVKFPIALVFGSETFGVSKEAVEAADQTVFIPMFGINHSLNVTVSAGIVSYWILQRLYPTE